VTTGSADETPSGGADQAPAPGADDAAPDETPAAADEAAPASADETPPGAAGEASPARTRGWLSEPVFAAALVLVVLAAVFAGWAGWSWYGAAHAGPPASAQLRDRVLQAGEQAVQNFNTLDYRQVAQGLALWEQSSTGTLHNEIAAGRAQFEREIQQTKTVTTARILDGALTSLSARTARLIVAVQITVTPAGGSPQVKQSRLAGTLTLTPAGWKLSTLGQVPVGAAASTSETGPTGG
jgi:Mce-associated membrane protein